jgi:hypothetical protein
MEHIPWIAWIAITAIAFGSAASVIDAVLKNRRKIAEIQAGPARHEVLARLDAIEQRLERIERTLTEIPG